MQPRNAPKARPSHLTTADAVHKVSLKDSPLKTAKAGSFRGCRPSTETQHLSLHTKNTTVTVLQVSSSLQASWSHPSDRAIGPSCHSQTPNWWLPVPVTKSSRSPGAGYQAIKWGKREMQTNHLVIKPGNEKTTRANKNTDNTENSHFCPFTCASKDSNFHITKSPKKIKQSAINHLLHCMKHIRVWCSQRTRWSRRALLSCSSFMFLQQFLEFKIFSDFHKAQSHFTFFFH